MTQKSAFLGSSEKKNESECFQLKQPQISTGFLLSGSTFKPEGPNRIHLFYQSIYNVETFLREKKKKIAAFFRTATFCFILVLTFPPGGVQNKSWRPEERHLGMFLKH